MTPAKVCTIEVEERFPRGWLRRVLRAASELDADRRARQLARRTDVREVRVVVVQDGRQSRYTLKSRFPRPPKQPSAEWLAWLETAGGAGSKAVRS